jgi:hypothetical protein
VKIDLKIEMGIKKTCHNLLIRKKRIAQWKTMPKSLQQNQIQTTSKAKQLLACLDGPTNSPNLLQPQIQIGMKTPLNKTSDTHLMDDQ